MTAACRTRSPPPWQSTNSYQAIQLGQGPSAKQSSNYLTAATSLDGVPRNQLSVIRNHDPEGLGGLCKLMHLMAFVGTTLRRNPMHWRRGFIRLFVVSALTGCGVATGSQTSPPVTAPFDAGPTSSPQISGPAASGNTNRSGPPVIGAGSFPRSFS